MINVPLTYFVSLLLLLFCSFTKFWKEEGSVFPEAFDPANVCEEQTGLAHIIQKSLTFLRQFFYTVSSSGALASRADYSVCRAVVLLCDRAQGVNLSRFAKDIAAHLQCDSVTLLKLHFHQWETHIWPQSFPKMSMEHKVNSWSFCLLCLEEMMCSHSIGKCRIILFCHTVKMAFIYHPTLFYLPLKWLQLNWHNDCVLQLVCSVN